MSGRLSRRDLLASAVVVACAARPVIGQAIAATGSADPNCPLCGGIGRIPVPDAKPLVWLKGTALPKWESAVGERHCSICQPDGEVAHLAAEFKEQVETVLEKNRQWEGRTGWKLACIVTRHATVHTQLTAAQARSVGTALETLTLHLKKLTSSLVLASTSPASLELMLLWEKPSWEQFRKVMEGMYKLEELGESWYSARDYNAFDHFVTPHMYETSQSVRMRPPSCGAVFMVGRRQLNRATDGHAPFWLAEGFAAYGDHVVHKVNRWFTVYDIKQVPVGDWLAEARKLAAETKYRPWREMVNRELRDWEPADHFQTMAMVAFLLETEPAKFLDMIQRLKSGIDQVAAMEDAYRAKLDELEQRWTRRLLERRS
jgi:hypothetical protein